VNHRTAPVALRERLAVPSRELAQRLTSDYAALDADELAILSTCHRTEWYLASCSHDPAATTHRLLDHLNAQNRLSTGVLTGRYYSFTNARAAAHLFQVTAGLDSMVLGESEVTAQVKHAYAAAQAAGTAGPLLHRLFQKALHCAKVIRSQTNIAAGQASIGSVVTALAKELLADRFAGCEALLWGAGKAAETTMKHLLANGLGRLWIVNRTQDRAQQLAQLCRGGWLSWEQARGHLAVVDLAIVCTQAPHFVIDRADLSDLWPARAGRPLCLIDLAMPRNIDPAVARVPGVRLYNIDDLESIARESVRVRRHALEACRALIAQQVDHWVPWHQSYELQPARKEWSPPCGALAVEASLV
jgi:glutamyl-tRNA reductase